MLVVVDTSGLTALVLAFIVQILLTGLLTAVVGRSVLGDRITAGEAWRIALPRLPALLRRGAAHRARLIGPWAGLAAVLILLAGWRRARAVLIVVSVVRLAIASLVLDVWFWTMFSMSAAAVVLRAPGTRPGAGAFLAAGRASSFWRVFGILLLAGLIVLVASSVAAAAPSRSSPRRSPSGAALLARGDPAERGQPGDRRRRRHHRGRHQPSPSRRASPSCSTWTCGCAGKASTWPCKPPPATAQAPGDDFATVWRPAGPRSARAAGAAGAAQTAAAARPGRRVSPPPPATGAPLTCDRRPGRRVVTAAQGTVVAVLAAAGGGARASARKAAQRARPRRSWPSREYHHHVSLTRGRDPAVLHFLARIVTRGQRRGCPAGGGRWSPWPLSP